MSVDLSPQDFWTISDSDDGLVHLVCCCDHGISMCGINLEDAEWVPSDHKDDTCVVCLDIWPDNTPCPRCGCDDC